MPMKDLSFLMDRFAYIDYEVDVHLHGFGESLLCDDLPERVKMITTRKANFTPCIFTTLGYAKDKSWLESLIDNGLGKITVSMYGYDQETYQTTHGINRFELALDNLAFLASLQGKYLFKLRVLLEDFGENYPCHMPPSEHQEKKECFRRRLVSIGVNEKNVVTQPLHKFGEAFPQFTQRPKAFPCSICWGKRRSHIFVSWNLDVYPCAYDYDGTILWGNLRQNSLEEIYRSPARKEFIEALLHKNEPELCKGGCHPNQGHHDGFEYRLIKDTYA